MRGFLFSERFSLDFENHFLDFLFKESQKNSFARITVLVPSNLLGQHVKHALALRAKGSLNIRFVTFVDLATLLLQNNRIQTERVSFPPFGEEFMLQKLAKELPSTSYFTAVKEHKGFIQALKTTFHDLLSGGVTDIPPLSPKLKELGEYFSTHRKNYLNQYWIESDALLEAAQLQDASQIKKLGAALFCYGFYDFSEVQRKLLYSLSKHFPIHAWTFALPSSSSSPAFFYFASLGLQETKLQLSPSKPMISLSTMGNEEAEVEQTVRKILSHVSKGSLPLHQIAVLVRNRDFYFPLLQTAFERAGIPYYMDAGRSLSASPMGRALRLLLDHIGKPWGRPEFIDFLSIFPFQSKWKERIGNSGDWDTWTRKAQVATTTPAALSRLPTEFGTFVRSLLHDISFFEKETASWKELVDSLKNFLQKYAEPSDLRSQYEDSLDELLQLDSITSHLPISTLTRTVEQHWKKLKQPNPEKFEQGGVYIGTFDKVRGIPFHTVVLLGISEGQFPGNPRPDPLLLDPERLKINQKTGGCMAISATRMDEDRALFELISTQATHHVWISTPRTSLENQKEVEPSIFFIELAKTLEVEKVPTQKFKLTPELPMLDNLDWMARNVSSSLLNHRTSTLQALEKLTPLTFSTQTWIEKRMTYQTFTEYEGLLPPEKISKVYSTQFSPSDIAKFSRCPYQFFLSKILKLSEVDEPENIEQLEARHRGDLLHQILFEFFTELKKKQELPITNQNLPSATNLLLQIANKTFLTQENEKNVGNSLLWKTEKELMLADLLGLLEWEVQHSTFYVPYAFEVSFQFKKDSLLLRGQIDRIDLSKDGTHARVIDYKTGKLSSYKDGSLHQGKAMQLPVYLLALPHAIQKASIQSSEGVLLSTSFGQGFETVEFSQSDLETRKQEIDQIFDIVSKEISSGHFIPMPGKDLDNCKNCDFQKVCGNSVLRTYERKKEDPLTRNFKALEEIK